MTEQELLVIQRDQNRLKSLYMELANHENFNPYKRIAMLDMPKGEKRKDLEEWYIEEKERIEGEIEFYNKKIQLDRKMVEDFIVSAPYPEAEIIRYRIINNLSWEEIGAAIYMDRRTASRKFYSYIARCSE